MYKIEKYSNKFRLIEIKTENIIAEYNQFVTASKLKMRLERGKGFNGWTPSFLLNKYTKGETDGKQVNIQTKNSKRHSTTSSKKKYSKNKTT